MSLTTKRRELNAVRSCGRGCGEKSCGKIEKLTKCEKSCEKNEKFPFVSVQATIFTYLWELPPQNYELLFWYHKNSSFSNAFHFVTSRLCEFSFFFCSVFSSPPQQEGKDEDITRISALFQGWIKYSGHMFCWLFLFCVCTRNEHHQQRTNHGRSGSEMSWCERWSGICFSYHHELCSLNAQISRRDLMLMFFTCLQLPLNFLRRRPSAVKLSVEVTSLSFLERVALR